MAQATRVVEMWLPTLSPMLRKAAGEGQRTLQIKQPNMAKEEQMGCSWHEIMANGRGKTTQSVVDVAEMLCRIMGLETMVTTTITPTGKPENYALVSSAAGYPGHVYRVGQGRVDTWSRYADDGVTQAADIHIFWGFQGDGPLMAVPQGRIPITVSVPVVVTISDVSAASSE